MKDDKYWNDFYKNNKKDLESPSSFARFVVDKIKNINTVVELGCGNGRDTFELIKFYKKIISLDSSKNTIEFLRTKNLNNATFLHMDASDVSNLKIIPDLIYSRFFWHSINENSENNILSWAAGLPSGTIFAMECRSDKDEKLYKNFQQKHYRRYINLNSIIGKLNLSGYNIEYHEESKGLARYKKEDPYIIRIIARKK